MNKVFGVVPRTMDGQQPPDPEVREKAKRRSFNAEYKRRILQEAANCKQGELGALLRREGLYSSHLSNWRLQLSQAEEGALSPKKRGRKPIKPNPLDKQVEDLERENEQLQKKLSQAEAIIEVQKKISEILGIGPK